MKERKVYAKSEAKLCKDLWFICLLKTRNNQEIICINFIWMSKKYLKT